MQKTIYVREGEWESVTDAAALRDISVSRYLIECHLAFIDAGEPRKVGISNAELDVAAAASGLGVTTSDGTESTSEVEADPEIESTPVIEDWRSKIRGITKGDQSSGKRLKDNK